MKLKEMNQSPLTMELIFQTIQKNHDDISFITSSDIAKQLDIDFYLGYASEKTISHLYANLLSYSPDNALKYLSDIIYNKYKDKWNRLYNAFVSSIYDPIENYSMVEKENVATKVTNSTKTNNLNYGFNSDSAVPTNDNSIESVSRGSKDDNERVLTRSGNIGVTTSAQMIQGEINLREWSYYENIFKDVASVMCLPIYE